MKNNINFSILFCIFSMFLITSCEKTEIHKFVTGIDTQRELLPRSDCEECPGNDECCCVVWLESYDQNASLRLCGTSDGVGLCSGADYCGAAFSGGFQQIDLNYLNNREQIFCMGEGNPFWIQNYSITDVANIIVTCQNDYTAPQTLHVHLQPGEKFYFETDSSCEIATCAY